jgi:hypothetical protein
VWIVGDVAWVVCWWWHGVVMCVFGVGVGVEGRCDVWCVVMLLWNCKVMVPKHFSNLVLLDQAGVWKCQSCRKYCPPRSLIMDSYVRRYECVLTQSVILLCFAREQRTKLRDIQAVWRCVSSCGNHN